MVQILFGGSNANEGIGLFSLCFDWLYITSDSITSPWVTLLNQYIGLFLCCLLMPILYYSNLWSALNFPFMAQELFFENGTVYDQSAILDADNNLDKQAYEAVGQPYFAATWAFQLICNNAGTAAALVHTILWNGPEISAAIRSSYGNMVSASPSSSPSSSMFSSDNRNKSDNSTNYHFDAMKIYKEVPLWWYLALLSLSVLISLVVINVTGSGLEWWAFFLAVALSAVLIFFT